MLTEKIKGLRGLSLTVHYSDNSIRPNKPVSGVYLIDGVYIGASINIRRRIRQHMNNVLSRRHINISLQAHLLRKASLGEVVSIHVLSYDPTDEGAFIRAATASIFNSPNYGRPYSI